MNARSLERLLHEPAGAGRRVEIPSDPARLQALLDEARQSIATVVRGMEDTVTLLLVALGARGHVLMDGVPGIGKTTLAKAFADVTDLEFRRIQLTPDLMPADITGHGYFDQKDSSFKVRKGPVFTNVLLADEMNRTPPRTQSALLEVMQEQQVTIEGETLLVPEPFMVVATKNPIEVEGVYPLPEAERDRFMIETHVGYPDRATEAAILDGAAGRESTAVAPVSGLAKALQAAVQQVKVHPDVRDYALDIVRGTRGHPMLEVGASPRGAVHLIQAAQSHAAIQGRDYVVPDDVRDLVVPVLRHRLVLTADAEIQGVDTAEVLDTILDGIALPVAARA